MDPTRHTPAGNLEQRLRRWLLIAYVVLSLADLVMTWILVQGSGHRVYESNPFARDWLLSHGWTGLIIFKAGIVLVVAVACLLIARSRPRTSMVILLLGCAITGAVVIYSWALMKRQGLMDLFSK
jgi:cytochrome bd-type quinol oxidase subunit 2